MDPLQESPLDRLRKRAAETVTPAPQDTGGHDDYHTQTVQDDDPTSPLARLRQRANLEAINPTAAPIGVAKPQSFDLTGEIEQAPAQKSAASGPKPPSGKLPTKKKTPYEFPRQAYDKTTDGKAELLETIGGAFKAGVTPGRRGGGEDGRLLDETLDNADPNAMGKTVIPSLRIPVPHSPEQDLAGDVPGLDTYTTAPVRGADLVAGAHALGDAAKQMVYGLISEAVLPVLGPVVSKVGSRVVSELFSPEVVESIGKVAPRLRGAYASKMADMARTAIEHGMPPELAAKTAGKMVAADMSLARGAASGAAFQVTSDVAEGKPVTAKGVATAAAFGAALHGANEFDKGEGLGLGTAAGPAGDVKPVVLKPTVDPKTGKVNYTVEENPFAVLGLRADATDAEVDAAARRKLSVLHPDRNPSEDAATEFMRVSNARATIKAQRDAAAAGVSPPPAPPTPAAEPVEPTDNVKAGEKPVDVAAKEDEPAASKPSFRERVADVIDPSRKQKIEELETERRNAQRAAETDPLTGLGNIAAFQKARATAESDPSVAFITFDANHFKAINDNLGHSAGNAALQYLSQTLQRVGGSRVFRTGGDEFVVLAPAHQAEAIRDMVESESTTDIQGLPLSLTGTVGLTYDEADGQLKARKDAIKGKNTPAPEEVSAPDAGVAEQVQQGVEHATEPPQQQIVPESPPSAEPNVGHDATSEPDISGGEIAEGVAPVEDSGDVEADTPSQFPNHKPRPEFVEAHGEDAVADPDGSFHEIKTRMDAAHQQYLASQNPQKSAKYRAERAEASAMMKREALDMIEEYENQYGEDAADDFRREFNLRTKAEARVAEAEHKAHHEKVRQDGIAHAREVVKQKPPHPYLERSGEVIETEHGADAPFKDAEKASIAMALRGRHTEALKEMVKANVSDAMILKYLGENLGQGGAYYENSRYETRPGKNPAIAIGEGMIHMFKPGPNVTVLAGKKLAEAVRDYIKAGEPSPIEKLRTKAEAEKPAEPAKPEPFVPTADKPMELSGGRKAYKEGDTWHLYTPKTDKFVPFTAEKNPKIFEAMEAELAKHPPVEKTALEAEPDERAAAEKDMAAAKTWEDGLAVGERAFSVGLPERPTVRMSESAGRGYYHGWVKGKKAAEAWDPKKEPWRVTTTVQSNQRLDYGYATRVKTYATEADARTALTAPFGRGEVSRELMFAQNADAWRDRGKWVSVKDGKHTRNSPRPTEAPKAEQPKEEPAEEQKTEEPKGEKSRVDDAMDAARERIKNRRKGGTRLFSGIDPEELADYAIIGAGHIIKGARTLAEWSSAMLEDVGDDIRAHLAKIWNASLDILNGKPAPEVEGSLASTMADEWATAKEFADMTGESTELERAKEPEPETKAVAPAEPEKNTSVEPTDRLISAIEKLSDKIEQIGSKPADNISGESRPGEKPDADTKAGTEETGADRTPAVAADRGSAPEGGGSAEVRGAEADGGAVDEAGQPGGERDGLVRKSGAADRGKESGPADELGAAKRAGNSDRGSSDPVVDPEPTPAQDAGQIKGQNYVIQPEDLEDLGGPKGRAKQNIEAIRLAKQLTKEKRPATMDEQKKLVRFVGWGGLADMFPISGYRGDLGGYVSNYVKPEWKELSAELKELLSPEEYETAIRSTQYAHYTSPQVISAMYDALKHMGVDGSIAAIEPGAGVGHFVGMSPFESRFTAVEMDHLSAEILGHLYPESQVYEKPYQKVVVPDNSMDIAIGNPPFGDIPIHDRKYGTTPLKIHDYFFVKSLDKVRPGGILAFVTSTGTLDKAGRGGRQLMADRADFLGAVRLPSDAFKKNANTEVTTDILFFQKRAVGETPHHRAPWMALKDVDTPVGTYKINEYFVDNPSRVLGDWTKDKLTGQRLAVKAQPGDFAETLRPALANALPANIYVKQGPASAKGTQVEGNAPEGTRDGQWVVQRGKIARVVNGSLVDAGIDPKSVAFPRISKLIKIGEAARAVMDANEMGVDDKALAKAQRAMTKLYDAFVEEYGPINKLVQKFDDKGLVRSKSRPNLLKYNDPINGPLVRGLEDYDPVTGQAKKTALHDTRMLSPRVVTDRVEAAWQGVAASLVEHGRIDMPYIEKLYGKPEHEIVAEMGDQIFRDPLSGHYVTKQQYLSGNVKEKLAIARSMVEGDGSLAKNIEALEKALPKDVTPLQMKDQGAAGVGATWIAPETYLAFINDVMGMRDATLTYRQIDGAWSLLKGGVRSIAAYKEWSTSAVEAIDLFRDMLAGNQTKVTWKDEEGRKHVDKEATEAANEKQKVIQERFDKWIFEDNPDRTAALVRRYNDLMNNTVVAQWDGSHLDGNMPGLATVFRGRPLKMAPHQLNVVWQFLSNGNTLMAHEVGAGKTMAQIAMGMEAKRMGLVKKPMYVVPNSMVGENGQFSREFLELYPAAKILVADDHEFHTDNRREFLARVATGDWDAVIISHSSFALVPTSPDFAREVVGSILAEYQEALEHATDEAGDSRFTVKGLQKAVEKYQAQLDELNDLPGQDKHLYFDQLGVDMLVVDEAHNYKNLSLPSTTTGINFAKAKKTTDMYIKTRFIEKVNPGRGLVFSTATPVSNAITEMYTMMRYLMEPELKRRGYGSFDAWAHDHILSYAEEEITAIGTFESKFKPRKYKNAFAMAQMFRSIADVKTREELNLPTPPIVGGEHPGDPELVVIPGNKRLRAFMKQLQERWDNRPTRPEKGDDGVFPIMNDGRFASIDARLVKSKHALAAGHDNSKPWDHSKADYAAKRIYEIWNETKALRGTQMVFSDLAVPKKYQAVNTDALREQLRKDPDLADLSDAEIEDIVQETVGGQGDYDIYNDIKDKLVEMGVPASEVEFIQEGGSNKKKRQAIIDRLKSGQTRILIGSTPMMGEGVNAQDRMVALHHLDVPYKPAWLQQRDGRIDRQGNKLYDNMENGVHKPLIPGIRILRYILKGSYDQRAWQILENKARFIEQGLKAKADSGLVEEVGGTTLSAGDAYAIIKSEGSDNPFLMDAMQAKANVKKLEREAAEWKDKDYSKRVTVGQLKERYQRITQQARNAAHDANKLGDLSAESFSMKIAGKDITDRKLAGASLLARVKALVAAWTGGFGGTQEERIGEFHNLPLYLTYTPWSANRLKWELRGLEVYEGKLDYTRFLPATDARATAAAEGAESGGSSLITQLEHIVGKIKTASDDLRADAEEVKKQAEEVHATIGQPFPKTGELEQAKSRFKELDAKAKSYVPADATPEEGKTVAPSDDEADMDSEGDYGSPAPRTEEEKATRRAVQRAVRNFNRSATPDMLPLSADRPADPVLGSPAAAASVAAPPTPPPPATGTPVSAPQVMHQLARITAASYESIADVYGPLQKGQVRSVPGKVVPFRVGHLPKWALGVWKTHAHVIRTRSANDISTGAHEVAHAMEQIIFGRPKGSPWKGPRVTGKMGRELVALGKRLYGSRYPQGGYKREGFAEYVRMWITGVDQRGRHVEDPAVFAPEFHKWFEGTFLQNQPGVAQELKAAREMAKQWYGQGAKARALMSIAEKSSMDLYKEKIDRVKKFFSFANHIDSAQPIYELVQDAVAQQGGVKLKPSEDPYMITAALRLTHSARAAFMVNNGMIDIAGNVVGAPLADIRALVENRRKDFMVYLWARRTISLHNDPVGRQLAMAQGKPFKVRESGLSIDDAIDLYNDLDSPDFERAASMVYDWNKGVRNYAAQASPMFAQINDAIEARDPGNYIPLKREFDELDAIWKSSGGTRSSFTKKLKGSGRRVLDPFESMISQAEQTIRAAHQRAVIESIVSLEKIEGVGDLIEEVEPSQVPAAQRTIEDLVHEINRKIYALDPTAPLLKFDDTKGPIDSDIINSMVTFFQQPYSPKPGQLIVPVKRADGVHWYQVNEPLYKSLMGMDVYRLPGVVDLLLGKPVRMLRAGTTGLRASFGLVWNTMRDVQTFEVNSQGDNALKLLGLWADGLNQSFKHQLGLHTSDYMTRYLSLGGQMSQQLQQDMSSTRRVSRQLFQGRMIRTMDPRNVFDLYREVISAPEAGPRVAELRVLAKKVGWAPGQPMTMDQSLEILLGLKQVTTDFTAAGSIARVMNQIIPFYNSAIQGPRATVRAFKRDPKKVMGRGAALAIAALALYWKHKDEDWYKEMDWTDRFTNWHFPFEIGERKYLLRIPRAFDIGLVFSAMPEAFLDAVHRHDPEAAEEWFKVFMRAMNPIALPPLAGEAYAQAKNEDNYFKTPIVPGSAERKRPAEQYNEYTTRMSIRIGQILNVSPMRLDHAIRGLAGPAATDLLGDLGLGPKGVKREFELADLPLIGRAFPRGGQEPTRSLSMDKLYARLKKAEEIQASDVVEETEQQRQARLALADAAAAVSGASYLRTRIPSFKQRQEMSEEIRKMAQEAVAQYDAAMQGGTPMDRAPFTAAKHEFKFRKDSTEAALAGKRLPRRKRERAPRRPPADE